MSILLPALFATAGLFAVLAIWHAMVANAGAIAALRRQVSSPGFGNDLIVNFREEPLGLDALRSVRRPRQVRFPAPKPVTHRLHQFAKAQDLAC